MSATGANSKALENGFESEDHCVAITDMVGGWIPEHGTPIRTGLFKFVRHGEVEAHHRLGWMIVADLGGYHGQFSVLMWRCGCYDDIAVSCTEI